MHENDSVKSFLSSCIDLTDFNISTFKKEEGNTLRSIPETVTRPLSISGCFSSLSVSAKSTINKMKLFLFCFLLLAQIHGSQGCFIEERTALLHIKSFLYKDKYSHNESIVDYPPSSSWVNYSNSHNNSIVDFPLSSWVNDSSSDCCRWSRVKCDPISGHVTKLNLQDGLGSEMNASLTVDFSLFQNFTELKSLNLSNGDFQGWTHVQGLCGLTKLRVLDLSYNMFYGPLPMCLGNLTSLQALDLTSNHLRGEIPTVALANLASLEYLSLSFNYFEGLFTLSSFANNSRFKILALEMDTNNKTFQVDTEGEGDVPWLPSFQMEFLHMPSCKLNMPRGILPSFLSNQHELMYLDLSDNNLVGLFPNWLLVNNTKLESLILHDNSFTGPFELPANVHILPHPLSCLKLAHNQMEGMLPKEIGNVFPNLEYLSVSGNKFEGNIPNSVGNMSKLRGLDLSKNTFFGEVPGNLWTGCASLRFLIFSDNGLSGQLFPSALNFSHLQLLHVDNNDFIGTLQLRLWQLPLLKALDVSNNKLSGIVPDFIGNFSSLQLINLAGNNFTGALPRELCKLDIYHVELSHNKLSGPIPACYLNMERLFTLHLQSNSLVGSIRHKRNVTSWLTSLDLRDNNLSGTIPDLNGNGIEFLKALLLGGNQLHGQIPNSLCQLKEINFLDLSHNNLTGTIPACFASHSFGGGNGSFWVYADMNLQTDFWYQYRHLHLQLHFEENDYPHSSIVNVTQVEFSTKASLLSYTGRILEFMSGLDLSCNQLTGVIPHEMGYLASLHALNLSHNHLNGSIPESFHNLQAIESLDLSYNNLSGKIPPQLQDLNFLAVFNVSYNNLSGTAPDKGQFGSFDESSFTGNPYLSWKNSNRGTTGPLPTPATSASGNGEEDESMLDFTVFYWSFAASYVTVLVVLVTIIWINPRWRRAWFYFIETCLFKCFHRILNDAFY